MFLSSPSFWGRNLCQTAANAYVCSIMSLLHWNGSRFLKTWDGRSQISELTSFYEAAKVMYPLWCQNYPFERWIGFLESFNLILGRESCFFITIAGREFLKYLVGTGVSRSAYHTDGSQRDGYFKSAARDQEFIFEKKKPVEEWEYEI